MSSPPSDADLVQTVAAFVLRARRVLAHSLARDDRALEELADSTWTIRRTGESVTVQRQLPEEEVLESLAARVRPLILNDDPVFYGTVLKALRTLLHRADDHEGVAWTKALAKDWERVDPRRGHVSYTLMTTDRSKPGSDAEASDAALTLSWFYGDLVHADAERIAEGTAFGMNERFAAAAVRTAQLTVLTRDTLTYIRHVAEAGTLRACQDLVTHVTEVEVAVTQGTAEVSIYQAGMGTTLPQTADEPLGPEWNAGDTPWLAGNDGTWKVRIPWSAEPTA